MDGNEWRNYIIDRREKLADAMRRIDQNRGAALFVTGEDGRLCGSVSDGDVRRWILKTGRLDAEVWEIMNREPKSLRRGGEAGADALMRECHITALPVLDDDGCICGVVGRENGGEAGPPAAGSGASRLEGVCAVIMAGGKGTRLYPYTKILPKPLIPIGDVPIMERIIDEFCGFGVDTFFVSVNYKKSMIRAYFSEFAHDYRIEYVEEQEPLGTAGGIRLIREELGCPVFVTNCDILIRADYADIYRHHLESGNDLTIVTALKDDTIPYGVVHSGENGEVTGMEEKPRRSYMVNTGMYVVSPETIRLIPENTFFHMTDLAARAIETGRRVGMYPVSEDSFLDMGEFSEMKRMERKLEI